VDDGFQVEQGRLEQGIDDDVVEVSRLRNLVPGVDHALRDDFGRVLAAAAQAAVQLFPRRRQDEDQHGAREDALDLQRALEVDLQHDIVAITQALLHRGAGGAVAVAVDLRPLEEVAVVDHLAEGIGGDKPVFTAVFFLAARGAGGVRDRHHEAGVDLQQGLDEAGLAGAGRGGDDVEVAGVVGWMTRGGGQILVAHFGSLQTEEMSELSTKHNFIGRNQRSDRPSTQDLPDRAPPDIKQPKRDQWSPMKSLHHLSHYLWIPESQGSAARPVRQKTKLVHPNKNCLLQSHQS
jgi:hypothetical protein